ncbi:MAG: DUF2312 domain-containing protein [Proteobacteria bacterium]|jgi:uncharacterized protein (UPF0335 family)|nr:DUF2312 domain-containing protein [Pseudomonadota bacterium]MBT6271684.1 DUF2312 domain-containing protein [Paracoccaceae bacterium]MBT6437318.1 DUF2312 domain-containing protein [Paracoccaceae bacterium]MBT7731353.1 DUF2312 domain-containing protein [Rhodospirillaceae bacterium]MDG2373192.1 DUF2312 domain-containing protein [Paracoccaceae bacterium]|tara:strand:- start:46 stop:306 length:261 start_codon:yes stop_codon:yes gene_type:complete
MSDTVSTDSTYRVTADELRQFIERFERLEMERKDLLDQQKEVLAEAKSRGYDTRVIKKVMAIRRRDPQEVLEEDAVLDLYKEALGM